MYRHCIYCSADLRSNEALEADDAALTAFLAESQALLAPGPRKKERG